jgi:hypothetical protein
VPYAGPHQAHGGIGSVQGQLREHPGEKRCGAALVVVMYFPARSAGSGWSSSSDHVTEPRRLVIK